MAKRFVTNTGVDEQSLEAAGSLTILDRKAYICLWVCNTDGIQVNGVALPDFPSHHPEGSWRVLLNLK